LTVVPGSIDYLGLLGKIGHSFLRERGPDDPPLADKFHGIVFLSEG
jgi:hypothetical protein